MRRAHVCGRPEMCTFEVVGCRSNLLNLPILHKMVMLHLFVLAWQEWERREKVGKRPTRPEPAPTQFVWNLFMSTCSFICP